MAGYICPGYGRIYLALPNAGANYVPGTWYKLPHTVTWELQSNIEDPTEIRTSDTAGSKVAVGVGATTWTLAVSSALCEEDWLYSYILQAQALDWPTNPSAGVDAWFCLMWQNNQDDAPSASITWDGTTHVINSHTENSVYCRGTVNPTGFGFDNDSTDPAISEWTANITWGPSYPGVATPGQHDLGAN